MTFPPFIIWAKALFFFQQLFPVVARTWLEYRTGTSFLGPKFRFLVQRSDFCHTTRILVNDPFLDLGMAVNFPPWEQLFSVVARTWLGLKSVCLFLGPKFQFLAKKSDFCHTTPIFVDDPFLALDMTVNFPPWKRFFDFPFRSYSCFRKKIRRTCQKVFPLPTVGFYCTVTALARAG